jgi:hypothetical protein
MKETTPVTLLRVRWVSILGVVSVVCGLLGILAWIGYGKFAMRGIHYAMSKDMASARHAASCAGICSFAELGFGAMALGLGWLASNPARNSGVSPSPGRLEWLSAS